MREKFSDKFKKFWVKFRVRHLEKTPFLTLFCLGVWLLVASFLFYEGFGFVFSLEGVPCLVIMIIFLGLFCSLVGSIDWKRKYIFEVKREEAIKDATDLLRKERVHEIALPGSTVRLLNLIEKAHHLGEVDELTKWTATYRKLKEASEWLIKNEKFVEEIVKVKRSVQEWREFLSSGEKPKTPDCPVLESFHQSYD